MTQVAATQPQQQEATTPPTPAQTVTQALATVDHRSILTSTLLMTAQVIVESSEGSKVNARSLLDTGATTSLVTQRLVQQLKLKCTKHNLHIHGVQDISIGSSSKATSFKVSPTYISPTNIQVSAAVVSKVTANLPHEVVREASSWSFLKEIQLANPSFDCPGQIDMILGANVLDQILLPEMRRGSNGQPSAIRTIFGWTITGPY